MTKFINWVMLFRSTIIPHFTLPTYSKPEIWNIHVGSKFETAPISHRFSNKRKLSKSRLSLDRGRTMSNGELVEDITFIIQYNILKF